MIKTRFNISEFSKTMNNVIDYSFGFLDGANKGKGQMLEALANSVSDMLGKYIDSSARSNPDTLHHIYEWYRTGSPEARLYDIKFTVSAGSINFFSTFKQSSSVSKGSTTPFVNKASVMEQGMSVTIVPRKANVLSFNVDGQQVFTRGPVVVNSPGGPVAGEYEKIFDQFFSQYFSQSFLSMSGVKDKLGNPKPFKENFAVGSRQGKSAGIASGHKWITSVKIGVE